MIDQAIEQYLLSEFGVNVDFDLYDALERLIADGIVREESDGTLVTLQPDAAAAHLDAKWDAFLDNLPALSPHEGQEFAGDAAAVAAAEAENEAQLRGAMARET